MRANTTDLALIARTIGSLRSQAMNELAQIDNYLHAGEFGDKSQHVLMASHVGNVLERFADIQMWADWHQITTAVIEKKGDAATVEDVQAIMLAQLLGRTSRLTQGSIAGPLANTYLLMLAENYSQTVSTLQHLTAAEKVTLELCGEIAPSLGLSAEAVYDKLRAGDENIGTALAQLAVAKATAKLQESGMSAEDARDVMSDALHSADPAVAAMAKEAGLYPTTAMGAPAGAQDLSESLGLTRPEALGAPERSVPRYPVEPDHHNEERNTRAG